MLVISVLVEEPATQRQDFVVPWSDGPMLLKVLELPHMGEDIK